MKNKILITIGIMLTSGIRADQGKANQPKPKGAHAQSRVPQARGKTINVEQTTQAGAKTTKVVQATPARMQTQTTKVKVPRHDWSHGVVPSQTQIARNPSAAQFVLSRSVPAPIFSKMSPQGKMALAQAIVANKPATVLNRIIQKDAQNAQNPNSTELKKIATQFEFE